MRRRRSSGPKRKKVSYELIPRESQHGQTMYPLLQDLVDEYHDEITGARIALAWSLSWKPDPDGRLTLGKCKKASDLDRELAAFDFVVLLNKDFWTGFSTTDEQRKALLDHELCHATVKYDKDTGEPEVDERGRTVYRLRKHDLEEFREIVERHGLYKRDLERFASAILRSKQGRLDLDPPSGAPPRPAPTQPRVN